MSKRNSILAHVFSDKVRPAVKDPGMARTVEVLVERDGKLVRETQTIPGPRALIKITSSRLLKVEWVSGLVGKITIAAHSNNPKLAGTFLDIEPAWRTVGQANVLVGLIDSQGSIVNFEILDTDFEA